MIKARVVAFDGRGYKLKLGGLTLSWISNEMVLIPVYQYTSIYAVVQAHAL